jgi:autotransporter-associated beta strand protein
VPAALAVAGVLAAVPASAANFNVANDAQLRTAITSAQNGDTITFTANITLSANLPQVQRNVTINGGNFTLSGNNQFRGLFVQSGTVAINDLTIANAKAQGGNGGNGGQLGGGGGGGAGLGGALYVASGANVTVSNVSLQNDVAQGGNGAVTSTAGGNFVGGGGGGMLGDGTAAQRGSPDTPGQGGAGGGGNGGTFSGGTGASGGFGGGGGGGSNTGGAGGFGGGGGGAGGDQSSPASGGFGGGSGSAGLRSKRAGGGGAGLGGAVFVQQGGNLALAGSLDISANTAAGGIGGGDAAAGKGFGSGIFLQGNGSFSVAPGAGQTQTIGDAIVDQTGVAGSGGSWSLVKNGAGTTILTGANAYSGGTTVGAGVLQGNSTGLQGNITNNASVVFNQAGSGTYAGSMSGTGSLTKTGAGDLSVTGTNSYSGGTTVTGGTLLFASDASLGAAGSGIALNNGAVGTVPRMPAQTINRPVTITNSGGFRVDNSNPLTWSGVIGGNGQLVKSGDSTMTLSGANTYAGGTMVTGGFLRFTNDANLGAAGTGITLNGGSVGTTTDTPAATSIGRSIDLAGNGGVDVALHPLIWSGNIGGSGQFIKSGNGELELTGTDTYTGGTLVQRGNLRIDSDSRLGAAGTAITLQDNGSLRTAASFATGRPVALAGAGGVFQVDDGMTMTLSGVVSGTNLTKVDRGTLLLTGANTYTGNTNVFGGTVQGGTGSIRGNIIFDPNAGNPIARSVTFDQASTGTFAGNITGIGSLTKTGAGTLILAGNNSYSTGTTVSAGILQGTTASLQGNILNNAAVIFDQATSGTYAGNMTGSGTLTKNGTGKVSLTGTSSVGGGTTINAGGLAVNNRLTSNVTLNKGGALSGVGNITGDITNNGGTIEPGNSIGNITINGNLIWNSGTFDVEVDPSGASDRITIVGAGHKVTVHAGTLQVMPQPGVYVPNTKYTILTAPAGGIATFSDITGGVGFLTPALSFDDTNLYLSLILAPNAFRSAGQTPNQQAVGGVLDAMAASGNVGGVVTTMANLDPQQAPAALQALSPEPYADFGTLNVRAGQLFMNAVGQQLASGRGLVATGGNSVALAPECEVSCDAEAPSDHPLRAWISGIGGAGGVPGDGNTSGLTYNFGGTAVGIDYRLDPRFLVGLAAGYSHGTQWTGNFQGNGTADTFSAALYGSYSEGRFYADALAGYAHADNWLTRPVSIPGLAPQAATGRTGADQFLGQLEAGYGFGLYAPAQATLTPFARMQVVTVSQAAFTESGADLFDLSVAAQATTSVRSTLGVDLAGAIEVGARSPLALELRLGWMHEYADTNRPITAAFAGVPTSAFTVAGASPPRDSAVIGLSASLALSQSTSLYLGYDGELGGGADNHAFNAGLRIVW